MMMKIMVVEDSIIVQEQLKEMLTAVDDNIEIKQAFGYSEALHLFPHELPENVFMDVSLPDGNSLVLLQRFKSIKPETKVIMMVNFPPGEFTKKCRDMGADDFFEKSNIYSLLHSTSKNRIAVN